MIVATAVAAVLLAPGAEAVRVNRDMLAVDTATAIVDSSSFDALEDGFVARQMLEHHCTGAPWYKCLEECPVCSAVDSTDAPDLPICVMGGKVYGCYLATAGGLYGDELPGSYGYYGEEEYEPNYEKILHMFVEDDTDPTDPHSVDPKGGPTDGPSKPIDGPKGGSEHGPGEPTDPHSVDPKGDPTDGPSKPIDCPRGGSEHGAGEPTDGAGEPTDGAGEPTDGPAAASGNPGDADPEDDDTSTGTSTDNADNSGTPMSGTPESAPREETSGPGEAMTPTGTPNGNDRGTTGDGNGMGRSPDTSGDTPIWVWFIAAAGVLILVLACCGIVRNRCMRNRE